jgi:hypothetical protein
MKSRTVIIELLKERREWQDSFRSCCETSVLRLRPQLWQFRDELADQDHRVSREELEDVLFDLAQRHFSDSPAADFSVWASLVYGDALTCLQEHFSGLSGVEKEALDLSDTEDADERMEAPCWAEDRAAFREAVHEYEGAGPEAFHRVRSRGAA